MADPMTLRARVAAPPAAVLHAITDAATLRIWLAEHAEVELPERYEFWGRYTPEGDAPHQRLLRADDRGVRFAWLLDGVETTTSITLEPEGSEATIITLTQSHFDFQEAIEESSIRGVLQTFWALALANLVDHLEGREPTAMVDFTSAEMQRTVLIDALAEQVFDSLIDSATVSRWFGFPIEIEPHVGGRVGMGGLENNPHPAKIVELDPGRRMSIDWGGPVGVTTWELDESSGRTRLTLVQSGFGGTPPYAGWGGNLSGLAELRRFHELPDWQPIWIPDDAGVSAGG